MSILLFSFPYSANAGGGFLINNLIFTPFNHLNALKTDHRPHGRAELPIPLPRSDSTSEFQPLEDKEVEYFFASDASAVIEHTNRVIFLEVIISIFQLILRFLHIILILNIKYVDRMMMLLLFAMGHLAFIVYAALSMKLLPEKSLLLKWKFNRS